MPDEVLDFGWMVLSTNVGEFIWAMCSRKMERHGAAILVMQRNPASVNSVNLMICVTDAPFFVPAWVAQLDGFGCVYL